MALGDPSLDRGGGGWDSTTNLFNFMHKKKKTFQQDAYRPLAHCMCYSSHQISVQGSGVRSRLCCSLIAGHSRRAENPMRSHPAGGLVRVCRDQCKSSMQKWSTVDNST